MTINQAIDRFGDSAEGSITLNVHLNPPHAQFQATHAGFAFLAALFSAQADESETGGCKVHIEPFSGGDHYFRNSTSVGIFLHVIPCDDGLILTPGISWFCWRHWWDDIEDADRSAYDPSFIMIEASADAFRRVAAELAKISDSGASRSLSPEETSDLFAVRCVFGLDLQLHHDV